MTAAEELGEDTVEDLKFAGDSEEHLVVGTSGVDRALDLLERERVVADLHESSAHVRTKIMELTFRSCMIWF